MVSYTCFGRLDVKQKKIAEKFAETHGSAVSGWYREFGVFFGKRSKKIKQLMKILMHRFKTLDSLKPARIVKKHEFEFEGTKVHLRIIFEQPFTKRMLMDEWVLLKENIEMKYVNGNPVIIRSGRDTLFEVVKALGRDEFKKFTGFNYLIFEKRPFKIVCLFKEPKKDLFKKVAGLFKKDTEKALFEKAVEYFDSLNIEKDLLKKYPLLLEGTDQTDMLQSKKDTLGKPLQKNILEFARELDVRTQYDVFIYSARKKYKFGYDVWGFLTSEEAKLLSQELKKQIKQVKDLNKKFSEHVGCGGPGYDLIEKYRGWTDFIKKFADFLSRCTKDQVIVYGTG